MDIALLHMHDGLTAFPRKKRKAGVARPWRRMAERVRPLMAAVVVVGVVLMRGQDR